VFAEENLGMVVEPAQVRLITTADDLYSWKVLPGKEHLFEKQLSKHSIGAYMELFRDVGDSFEAVLTTAKLANQEPGNNGNVTFSGRIIELERDKSALAEELCRWKTRAARAENDREQLRLALHTLSQEETHKTALINYYRNVTKSLQEASSAFESWGFR
jgi:hypothetical protein